MQFSTIYYLTICAPTIEKSLKMIDEYVDHGARDFQLDMLNWRKSLCVQWASDLSA